MIETSLDDTRLSLDTDRRMGAEQRLERCWPRRGVNGRTVLRACRTAGAVPTLTSWFAMTPTTARVVHRRHTGE